MSALYREDVRVAIAEAADRYHRWASDPYRCDHDDPFCQCDQGDVLLDHVHDVIRQFPFLRHHRLQVLGEILAYHQERS